MDIVTEQGYRQDGRKAHELRRINYNLGVYSQADGSAYLEQGFTKVLAAVYGPHEVTRNKNQAPVDKVFINCQYSAATFSESERKVRPRGDRKSYEFAQLLRTTFEAVVMTDAYPRSQLDIYCEVLQSDGGNLSACINAATLALIDAGVPLKNYVVSCTCVCYNEVVVVDANRIEENAQNAAQLVVAVAPKHESAKSEEDENDDDVVLLELNGKLHADRLDAAIDQAVKGCRDVSVILRRAVREHVTKVANCLGWQDEHEHI